MSAYQTEFRGAAPLGTTDVVLSGTGSDRLVLVHAFTVSANTVLMWANAAATVPLTTMATLSSGLIDYSIGPLFFGSSEALLGGLGTSSGYLHVEAMRL